MRISPDTDTVSLVLVGDLNPRIFRPDWFAAQGILEPHALAAADIEIVHSEVTKFSFDWLTIKVDKKRFVAVTEEPPHVRLADLVVRTFGEFLIHTPIYMLGINRAIQFPVKDLSTLDIIGKALAPHDAWGEWGPQISGTTEKHGGLRSLTMEQANLDDRKKGFVRAKVEPSPRYRPVGYGVSIDINDHYELSTPDNAVGCADAVDIIRTNFETSLSRSAWIMDQVMALAK
jgi:hypothetical protein